MIYSDIQIFKGMRRDIHPVKQEKGYLWDARNIRLTTREGDTRLSITNERGTKPLKSYTGGSYLGHTIVGDYLVLFMSDLGWDSIHRIEFNDDSIREDIVLYRGKNLGFDDNFPILAISDYESELVLKVYWVDGKNCPRVINVAKPELLYPANDENATAQKKAIYNRDGNYNSLYTDAPFGFVLELDLKETVTVKRTPSGSGIFAAGVILYVFTYYHKYGQESNIFWTSELLYTSHADRGGAPDDNISTSFDIRVENVQQNFQYLRIYSILRTSLDATPLVKRVADIEIGGNSTISFVDDGTSGDTVDPQMLLYIGGKDIVAGCIASKDNTLFLGDITYSRTEIKTVDGLVEQLQSIPIMQGSRLVTLQGTPNFNSLYDYSNLLDQNTQTFKSGETYRLGLQFQYKNGEWSEPVFIDDKVIDVKPLLTTNSLLLPSLRMNVSSIYDIIKSKNLSDQYVRVRPIIAIPSTKDMTILALGVLCPTVFNTGARDKNIPYALASWFMRPYVKSLGVLDELSAERGGTCTSVPSAPSGSIPECRHMFPLRTGFTRASEILNMFIADSDLDTNIPDISKNLTLEYIANHISNKEVTGEQMYFVDLSVVTLHSPDIEFNDRVNSAIDSNPSLSIKVVGVVPFNSSFGDIDIETSTPVSFGDASGFIRNTIANTSNGAASLISGLFYEDPGVDDLKREEPFNVWGWDNNCILNPWLTYLWHRSGSLNNDIVRPEGKGLQTAILRKKVVSNIRFSKNTFWLNNIVDIPCSEVQVFNSDQMSLIKIKDVNNKKGDITYYGNVDTLNPSYDKFRIVFGRKREATRFTDKFSFILPLTTIDKDYRWPDDGPVGDFSKGLRLAKDAVRIKYKSTPHAVFATQYSGGVRPALPVLSGSIPTTPESNWKNASRYAYWLRTIGTGSWDALTIDISNVNGLTECPEAYLLLAEIRQAVDENKRYGGKGDEALRNNLWIPAGHPVRLDSGKLVVWQWGDTWFQRYDCLKTYPFTNEDPNQVVEIGSFMCETRINIDGRYDRNRGAVSNLNMSPINFNLINPVYSLLNSFFNYRIFDEDYYKVNRYQSQILWTGTKNASAVQDIWTNLHMANTLDMDGIYGRVTSILPFNTALLGFQERGLAMILFNSRVLIQASDGVPIEIANSQKVEGTSYISTVVGCQDKFAVITTSLGVYFIDNDKDHIYRYTGESLENIGLNLGTLYWPRENHGAMEWKYNPHRYGYNGVRLCYDSKFQDVYFIPGRDLNADIRLALCFSEQLNEFTSLMDYGGAVMFSMNSRFFSIAEAYNGHMTIWENFKGKYNDIFNRYRPFSFSFISNDSDTTSQTKIFDTLELRADCYLDEELQGTYTHLSHTGNPVNYIRADNEYQDSGIVALNSVNFRKKFRIWRALIPRNRNTRQRIRNPWTKITLGYSNPLDKFSIVHDVTVKYTM